MNTNEFITIASGYPYYPPQAQGSYPISRGKWDVPLLSSLFVLCCYNEYPWMLPYLLFCITHDIPAVLSCCLVLIEPLFISSPLMQPSLWLGSTSAALLPTSLSAYMTNNFLFIKILSSLSKYVTYLELAVKTFYPEYMFFKQS